ncbi:pre-mRNA-processing factor 6-like, partial [Trifolium medium]|nr:pre-mRNA-processing factor 6-like [Trifolium medium]
MWLEACRLAANSDKAKAVIAEGVRLIPNSVKLWLQASNLENIGANRIRVLKKGIRYIPDS